MIPPRLLSSYVRSIGLLKTMLLTAVLNFVSEATAQTPGISGVNVVINRIGAEQGLSNNSVWAFTQDKQGFIWIGTSNGLNRFDGKQCVVYHASPDSTGLSNDWIWCLYCDQDSSLWIGTQNGLNRFDPSTRTFKKYLHDPADPASLSHNEVRSVLRDPAGVLWVGTKQGLNRYEEVSGTWTNFFPNTEDSTRQGDNFINAIHEDRQGTFWVGTGHMFLTGGGLFTFDPATGTFKRCRYEPLDPENSAWDWVTSVSEEASGTLWICSDHLGVYGRDLVTGLFTRFSLPDYEGWFSLADRGYKRPTTYAVKQVREDAHGALWISTWGSGLFRCNRRAKHFDQYLPDPSGVGNLLSPHINTIFFDRAGLLWVGTEGGGVNTASGKPFLTRHSFGKSFHIVNRVDGLFSDRQGYLWIGAIGVGAWRFNPKTQRSLQVFRDNVLTNFCQDKDGRIWTTTPTGLIRYDPPSNLSAIVWVLPDFGFGESTTRMYIDSEGTVWVGVNTGLYRIKSDLKSYTRIRSNPHDVQSITEGPITCIFEDRHGTIWIGTSEGLSKFNKEANSFTRFVHDVQDSLTISDNHATGMLEDNSGNLWIGSANGLDRFNAESSTFTRILHQPVDRMIADQNGRFWFGSGRTISMFDPASGRLRTFDESDGISGDGIIGRSHTIMNTGELVFGTNTGIVVFHPDSLLELKYVPPVVITGIDKFNRPIRLATSPDLEREITFEHDENVFSIRYAALSYDMPEYNQYAYRLEGFDKDWVYCGNRQEATYTNLDPGTYTFRVKGSNHDGVWNEAGTSLNVVIRPAYWQTWWFRGLVIVVVLGLVGSGVGFAERMRANRKIEKLERAHALERERARISQDMHDEVGASLSEISILSELVKRDLPRPEQAAARAQEISDRSGEVIQNIGEIIWALNPKNDPVESLIAYLRRYAGRYLELASIRCTFVAPDEVPAYHLTSVVRRNVFLFVKEALHNVVKHAAASEVRVDVETHEKTLVIRLQDNGKGFVPEDAGDTGNGLSSMRKRAADIDATIDIQSQPGCGTTVVMTVRV
jgi:ligand-binding sensor domain-containing protein/signal transduction histidine kinase